jgi:hypothetical protein
MEVLKPKHGGGVLGYNIIVVPGSGPTLRSYLKDALTCWGPYQTLMSVRYNNLGGHNTVRSPAIIQI